MRLLSEAEWEKAASWDLGRQSYLLDEEPASDIGQKRLYPWGDEFDQGKCNTIEAGIQNTTPVGTYSPYGDSPYGCTDMIGNVLEWTLSEKKDYPYVAEDDREDTETTKNETTKYRVLRGGAWDDNKYSCADRYWERQNHRVPTYGFRCGFSFMKEAM